MYQIALAHTLPRVFALREQPVESDIWHRNVVLERGCFYLIEANSGTGKSSLCSYLLGHRTDYEGIISFDEQNIRIFSPADWVRIRRSSLSMLFQDLRLFPELSALENVQVKNSLTHYKSATQIKEWFERLGIADKLHTPVCRMSFGQQQRVALMRALVQPFDFLLADEPTSHLDDANARIMAELLTTEARAQWASVVITSIGKHMQLDYDKIFRL